MTTRRWQWTQVVGRLGLALAIAVVLGSVANVDAAFARRIGKPRGRKNSKNNAQSQRQAAINAADQKAADADTALGAARTEVSRTEAAANSIMAALRTEFEASPEYRQALEALKTAQQAREAAEKELRVSLVRNPDYIVALQEREKADQRIADLNQGSPKELAAASTEAIKAASVTGKLFDAAAANSPSFIRARDQEKEASKHISEMQADFKKRAKDDPKFIAANHAAEEARIALSKADSAAHAAHTASSTLHGVAPQQ